ncbi:MAG TPA: hypothetical protein VIG33_13805 [Pseudobdellovibrionaceae bacterium]|jgi:hypothetical protein
MSQWIYASILSLTLFGCATGKCVNAASPPPKSAPVSTPAPTPHSGEIAMKPESKLDKVKVYKPDGSLQCGQGKAIPIAEMQKELKDIKVYSSMNKNDGMMRIQLCGSPTGNANVYEIDRKQLQAAIKLGFKEWTFDN